MRCIIAASAVATLALVATPYLVGIAALGFVVGVHELGHLAAGRLVGMEASTFSVGFGPALWSGRDRRGTLWAIRLFPLGGSVAPAMELDKYPIGPRAVMIAAGPLANLLLAAVLFALTQATIGLPYPTGRIEAVAPGSPASHLGFHDGDTVLQLNGQEIETAMDIFRAVSRGEGQSTLTLERKDGTQPSEIVVPNVGAETLAGLTWGRGERRSGPIEAIRNGVSTTFWFTGVTIEMVTRIVTGRVSVAKNVSGPIGTTSALAASASRGIGSYLNMLALLSIGLAVFNLLPIPPLDGGRLALLAVEGSLGRQRSLPIETAALRYGTAAMLVFIVWSMVNDVTGHVRSGPSSTVQKSGHER